VRIAFEEKLRNHEQQACSLVLLDVPLLFQAKFDQLCHHTVGVLAEQETRLFRIMERDHIDRDAALRRLRAQPEDAYYIDRYEIIVYNDGDIAAMHKEAVGIIKKLNIEY
jgi:dephospho-CoA kinase